MLITISAYADTLVIDGTDRGDKKLTAKWKANTYTITYNTDGGTLPSTAPKNFNVESAAFVIPQPTKTGYVFTGWTGSNGTTPQTTVTIPLGSIGDKSYTANWKARTDTKYTVIHQQEQLDGTYKIVDTDNLTGTTDTKVTPVVKTYTGFTAPATQTITIKGDGSASVTYKYTRNNYTITRQYRLENADGSFAAYVQIDSTSYKFGSLVPKWNRAADDTYKAASIPEYTVGTKDDTLSVNVDRNTATNTIQYRLQNADGTYGSYTNGWSGTLRVGESYTWSRNADSTYKAASKSVTGTKSVQTVQVNVDRVTYTVQFNSEGGSAVSSVSKLAGNTIGTLPTPTKSGYSFAGWYTAASGGTKISNTTPLPAENVTYYAHWTRNKAELTNGIEFNKKAKKIIDGSATKFAFSKTAPNTSVTKAEVQSDDSGYKIYVWKDNDVLKMYCETFPVYLNSDSSCLFQKCNTLTSLDLTRFDTSNVTMINSMFNGCSSLTSLDLSKFNTSNVTKMSEMFRDCSSLTELKGLSSFNTSNVEDMGSMFYGCSSITTIYASEKFNTDKLISSAYMFSSCTSLAGGNGTHYDDSNTDKTYARIDGGTSNPGYFTAAPSNSKKATLFTWDDEDEEDTHLTLVTGFD